MGKIEERIIHLKSDIEELRITAEKSQVAYMTGKKYSELLNDLDLSNSKNLPILLKTTKIGLSTYLEYLRDRVDIIRKISPKTAERLEVQVNHHEKLGNYLVEVMQSAKTPKQLDKKTEKIEFQKRMSELILNALTVDQAIDTCYNFLLDTITYLEEENQK